MKLNTEEALRRIEMIIPKQAYVCLTQIIRWADVWDTCHRGDVVDMSKDYNVTALLTPFHGFGNADVWQKIGPGTTMLIMKTVMDWMAKGESKDRPPLTEELLIGIAPTIAAVTLGAGAHVKVYRVLVEALEERPDGKPPAD